eukprot:scaffold410_cov125-Isochrysis_galbana.AAC.6
MAGAPPPAAASPPTEPLASRSSSVIVSRLSLRVGDVVRPPARARAPAAASYVDNIAPRAASFTRAAVLTVVPFAAFAIPLAASAAVRPPTALAARSATITILFGWGRGARLLPRRGGRPHVVDLLVPEPCVFDLLYGEDDFGSDFEVLGDEQDGPRVLHSAQGGGRGGGAIGMGREERDAHGTGGEERRPALAKLACVGRIHGRCGRARAQLCTRRRKGCGQSHQDQTHCRAHPARVRRTPPKWAWAGTCARQPHSVAGGARWRESGRNATAHPPPVAVVSRREERDELAAREALEAVHDALVPSHDELEPVGLQKLADTIGAETDHRRAALAVQVNALHLVRFGRVGPKQVEHQLHIGAADAQRPLHGADLVQRPQRPADAAVHAQDAAVDGGGHRHPLKHQVEAAPDCKTLLFAAQPVGTLVQESVARVHLGRLVVTPHQEDRVGVGHLEREQQHDRLEREQVVDDADVPPFLLGHPIHLEDAHQVCVLAVKVAKHLDWRGKLQQRRLRLENRLDEVAQLHHVIGSERALALACVRGPLARPEQLMDDAAVDRVFTRIARLKVMRGHRAL